MTQKTQRAIIFIIVGIFLLSTFAFTGLIIWQLTASDQNDIATLEQEQLQELERQMQEGAEPDMTTPEPAADALEGTQLQGFEPVDSVSELEIIDIVEGDGAEVQPGATVVAHYTGANAATGVIFQSSFDMGQPIPFSLDGVIQGWTEGVPGMKEGGTRRLIIPADMAYGEAGSPPSIGPNENLVFDIELVEIE